MSRRATLFDTSNRITVLLCAMILALLGCVSLFIAVGRAHSQRMQTNSQVLKYSGHR